jgi:hypothetical protein
MKTTCLSIAATLAAIAMLQAPDASARGSRAVSSGGEFSFRLESNGGSLPTYNHGGYTYVEGQRGERYSIRVFNHTGERIEAVVTVDGRDVITGREGNYRKQRGYVIQPYGSVLVDGFRTSWSGVAAFRFTDIADSYAARMGNASNVGVIGVAVFKEKGYQPPPPPPYAYRKGIGSGYGSGGAAKAPSAGAPCCDDRAESEADARSRQGIGTGYGEDQYSPASETSFERRGSRPNARLAIYYDDYQGLVSRGVIPQPLPYERRPVEPHPFPDANDPGFAPPPPTRDYYYWE